MNGNFDALSRKDVSKHRHLPMAAQELRRNLSNLIQRTKLYFKVNPIRFFAAA
jgi:hypothetical protein